MAQPLSIESKDWVYLITTRTAGSRLWLVNNKELESRILGALARYQHIHSVVIYAFILMGNHYHLLAKFPERNRALFMRDLNSALARLVGRHVSAHGRRSVWARRYSYQVLPRDEDVRHWFFYVALNPVSSGITRSVPQYPSYNSFFDAAKDIHRQYAWIDWSSYLVHKRTHPEAKPADFAKEYLLKLSRLPAQEGLSQVDYRQSLVNELGRRQKELVAEREKAGKGFLGVAKLQSQAPGAYPRSTKSSTRHSFRPLVLTLCAKARRSFLQLYFSIYDAFKTASAAFRLGKDHEPFPEGTYPPPRLAIC